MTHQVCLTTQRQPDVRCDMARGSDGLILVYRPQLQWPKSQGECFRGLQANKGLLHSWLLEVCRSVSPHLATRCAVRVTPPPWPPRGAQRRSLPPAMAAFFLLKQRRI